MTYDEIMGTSPNVHGLICLVSDLSNSSLYDFFNKNPEACEEVIKWIANNLKDPDYYECAECGDNDHPTSECPVSRED